jgi:hypothetical protein
MCLCGKKTFRNICKTCAAGVDMNFTEMNTPNLKSVFATVGGNKYLTTIKY